MKYLLLTIMMFVVTLLPSYGQMFGVKTNLLYDATSTINLGVEIGMGKRWTLDVSGNYNPWKYDKYQLKHWMIQPEVRYWFCEKFNGSFLGLHAHYMDYNVASIGTNDYMRDNRFDGYLYGGGLSYGYQWIVTKRFNVEATIGGGYAYMKDDRYPCTAACGESVRERGRGYWGITKAGVSLIYIIK